MRGRGAVVTGTGDHLELCGIAYRGGMHWVHTHCGDNPTPEEPDGWLKEIAADGSAGPIAMT